MSLYISANPENAECQERHNTNSGHWVITMSQPFCQGTLLLREIVHRVGAGSIWDTCVPTSQLRCEPKTDLKYVLNTSNCQY